MDKTNKQGVLPPVEGKFRSVLLFGPPGSGKGTAGRFIAMAGNHVHLSSGDIFRGMSPDSPAGKLFYRYAHKGHLVPDEVTVEIWRTYVLGLVATNRYFPAQQLLLLDGIPRTVKQVELLQEQIDLIRVIVLEMPNVEGLIKRLKRRALIEGRKDDMDEEVLRVRMEVYEKESKQILEHYPKSLISRFNAIKNRSRS